MTDALTLDCSDPLMRAFTAENHVYVDGLKKDAEYIQRDVTWLTRHYENAKRRAQMLRALPGFEVPAGEACWEAEQALERLIQEASKARDVMRDARKKFETEID